MMQVGEDDRSEESATIDVSAVLLLLSQLREAQQLFVCVVHWFRQVSVVSAFLFDEGFKL